MKKERADDFLKWMRTESKYRASVKSVKGYINQLKRVELASGVDLDEEFKKDEMANLLERYTHEAAHARATRPIATFLITTILIPILAFIETGIAVRDVTRRKSRINQYKKFCEKHPPK